jgi:hypothetical protein
MATNIHHIPNVCEITVPDVSTVATDVAARGLDIPKIQSVIHYDAARSPQVLMCVVWQQLFRIAA